MSDLETCQRRILELRGLLYETVIKIGEGVETDVQICERIVKELAPPERTLLLNGAPNPTS